MPFNFSLLSIVISLGVLAGLFFINKEIASTYIAAGRKTQLYFFLQELPNFYYKYFLVLPALLSLWIATIAYRAKEVRPLALFSLVLSALSLLAIFIRFWKVMV